MRAAIMQPYFFPYLGYFQLIQAVDSFVCLDDVSFIKKGWIHRNRLVLNGEVAWFTVPLRGASQYKRICDIAICTEGFERWKRKFLQSLESFYKKAPYYQAGLAIVRETLATEASGIADLARASIRVCSRLLGITTRIEPTSSVYNHASLTGEERLIRICKDIGARVYVNPAGGMTLYSRDRFAEQQLALSFVRSSLRPYSYGRSTRMPGLSILDVIMCCGPELTRHALCNDYQLG